MRREEACYVCTVGCAEGVLDGAKGDGILFGDVRNVSEGQFCGHLSGQAFG